MVPNESQAEGAAAKQLDERLRAALCGADTTLPAEGVDMSPEAITARLMDSFEMSALCLELARIALPPK